MLVEFVNERLGETNLFVILLLHLFQKKEEKIPEGQKQTLKKLWTIVAHSQSFQFEVLFENSGNELSGVVSFYFIMNMIGI